jgi:hypothetical protein
MAAVRILLLIVALFLAYVVGRAVGILLGIGPYPTEIAAIVLVVVVFWRTRH